MKSGHDAGFDITAHSEHEEEGVSNSGKSFLDFRKLKSFIGELASVHTR